MAKGESIVKLTLDSNQYERNVKNAKQEWDQLTSAMGMSKAVFSEVAVVMGAVTTAVKVAKDAFMQMESNVDEWGRTVSMAQNAYESFLASLNSDSWGNFFENIQKAVSGARDLYDALDRLGSINSNNTAAIANERATIQQLRVRKQNGEDVDLELKAAEGRLKSLQKDAVEAGKRAGREQLRQTIENAYNQQTGAGARGLSAAEMKNIQDQLLMRGQRYIDEQESIRNRLGEKAAASAGAFRYTNLNKLTEAEKKQYLVANAVVEAETRLAKGIDLYAQALNEEAGLSREEFRTNRYILQGSKKGGGGGSRGTGGGGEQWAPIAMGDFGGVSLGRSVSDVTKDLRRAQTEYNEAGDMFGRAAAAKMVEKFKEELDRMSSEGNPFADAYSHDFQKDIDKLNADSGEKKEKREVKMSDAMGDMASGISSMVGGLEQLGVDVPEGLKSVVGGIQGVVSILTGISTILSVIEAVSSADAILPFARGGVVRAAGGYRVPGNMMSGDRVPALLNSGEVVFNMAQQGNLASQMRSNGGNVVDAQPYVDGEKVFLGMNAHTRRTGNGEIVTTRMLRNYGLIKG